MGAPDAKNGAATRGEANDPSQREVSARHSLGEGDQIGLEREAIRSEPVANPAEAGDDLVGDEEGPRSFDGRLGLLEVAIRCGPHAARTDHRFAVETGNSLSADFGDGLSECIGRVPLDLGDVGHQRSVSDVVSLYSGEAGAPQACMPWYAHSLVMRTVRSDWPSKSK